MNELSSISSYEYFVYSLQNRYSEIKISNLILKPTGALVGELVGSLSFANNVRLIVRERLDFKLHVIKTYSYEVWKDKEKLYWYDPQPHPDDASLTSTHPHHKHVPPDIKSNRIPAQGLKFDSPNLTLIIEEIINLLL